MADKKAKLRLDTSQLERALTQAFSDTMDAYEKEQKDQLEASVYSWPRPTESKARGLKGSPREISDTGELAASFYRVSIGRYKEEFGYNAIHAALVHEGGTTSKGTSYPGRPWTIDAARNLDIAEEFRRNYRG
jgi:hypothetical protein